jgi:hypothetical protein
MRHVRLYKYFSEQKWADAFLDGSILFRSLSYFRDLEDENVREDDKEGVSIFRPDGGLVIHNKTQGTILTLADHGMETVVKQDEIFVFCASRSLTDELREKFDAVACVQISNIGAFCDRVTAGLPLNAKFPGSPGRQRIGRQVQYYRESGDCNPRWALPDVIATSKRDTYAWQDEFRLVFSLTDALDFEKIAGRIVPPGNPRDPRNAAEHHTYRVTTPSLRDICQLHEFTSTGLSPRTTIAA